MMGRALRSPLISNYTLIGWTVNQLRSATKVLSVISKPALIPWALKQGSEWVERNLYADEEDKKIGAFKYTSRLGLAQIVKGIKSAYRGSSGSAMETGTTAHEWIEDALKTFMSGEGSFGDDNLPDLPDDPDACNSIDAFKAWVGDNDIDFLSSEEKIYSRQDNYAGTLDCAAYVNGSLCIIDWKTSKGIYPEYHLQNAAYAQAWEDIHGKQWSRHWFCVWIKQQAGINRAFNLG